MTESEIHRKVAAQFEPTASNYAASAGHGNAAVLADLVSLAAPKSTDRLLDIATGAGHVALTFAPSVGTATALDLTPAMLRQVEQTAKDRDLDNVSTVHAKAEEIPFPTGSFEIVTVRLAPHHFADVHRFLDEVKRVLVQGGKFLFVDTVVPEDNFLDSEINRIELLRDPSHVRNYRESEWHAMLNAKGFSIVYSRVASHAGGTRMELIGWMNRINTPEENKEAVIGAFLDPSPEIVEALKIERVDDVVTFELPELTLLATLS